METSAPKRRKTSPSTALPVHPTTTSTTPPDAALPSEERSEVDAAQAGKTTRPKRASYASPTKASLSRYNPDILQRRLSSPTKSRPADDDDARAVRSQLTEDIERSAGSRRSEANPSRSPTRQLGGGLSARPRRTPVKPNPRPLPPPGPDDDDDEILNPFARRGLRRSPLAGLREPNTQEEPDLPPTPVHADNVASTPPTGIHSTPSHRPRRSRALAERIASSPTKRPPAKPGAGGSQYADEHILPTTETEPSAAIRPSQFLPKAGSSSGKTRPRPKPSDIRGVESSDAEAEKKREYNALLTEVAQLEEDLGVVARENERIRQLHLSGKGVAMPEDTGDVFDVLRRHLKIRPDKNDNPASQSDAWLQAALDPIAFLPFGKPSSGAVPSLFPQDDSTLEPEKPPVSHHPTPLTAREALPFLQAFTPLKLTSRITMLPQAPLDDSPTGDAEPKTPAPPLQHHSLTVSSDSAPGLFLARIDFTVNTATHAITSLAIPSINPPCAAAELSPLTAKILAEPEASSSALSRNVVVLTSAMGSWLRVAIRRAKVWRTLDRELGSSDALERTVARVRGGRTGGKLKRKGARGGTGGGDDDQGRDDADSAGVADWIDSMVDTEELLPFVGRQSMEIRIPSIAAGGGGTLDTARESDVPVLRVQWRIEFDWTGEATSEIRALVRLPAKWHHADDRTKSTLSTIPDLFDRLVRRGGGVVPAVETVVTLLAGDKEE